jgi:hypothetical protein
VPVYNVSMGLLHRCRPEQQPFRVIELPRTPSTEDGR